MDSLLNILLVALFIGMAVVAIGWSIVLSPLYDLLQKYRVRALLRRIRQNACRHCGYDLRESSNRCPECGGEIASSPERVDALLHVTDDQAPADPSEGGNLEAVPEASMETAPSTGSPPSPG